MDKGYLLNEAIAIAKEHAKSGNVRYVEVVLEEVYNKLKELSKDAEG